MLIVSILLILLGIVSMIGALADEQLIIFHIFSGASALFILMITLIIVFIKYEMYITLIGFGLLSIIIGGIITYYDHTLLLSRGFPAFGMMVSLVLILGGILLIINNIIGYRKSHRS